MNEIALEWVKKAEGDFIIAHRAVEPGQVPVPEGACFHAQQCAEKYLKAFLQEQQVEFPRRHDLMPLLSLCLPIDQEFEKLRDALMELDSYAVVVRYPGINVSIQLSDSALNAVGQVRNFLRRKLDLD